MPLIVSVMPCPVVPGTVILKALAPGLKTIAATSVEAAERVTPVVFERLKVATSAGPSGTVGGVQFAAVFQSPLVGLRLQVALSARRPRSAPSEMVKTMAQDRIGAFMAP